MARAAFRFGSPGASVADRLGALEAIVEDQIGPLEDLTSGVLPQATHFGGGTVYPSSSDFPLWLRGPDASPYATTFLTYNQFPTNAMLSGAGASLSELHYVEGTGAANQLDIPNFAWTRDPQEETYYDVPYRAYLDNIDLELDFGVQWTPMAIRDRHPWHCRVLLIADNEPFMSQRDAVIGTVNEVVGSQYAVRDLIAAQPGVDPAYVNGCSGRQVMFPMTEFWMCDQCVRSPLRGARKEDGELQITANVAHERQYAKQLQLGGVVSGGVDYAPQQCLTNPTNSTTVGFPSTGTTTGYTIPPPVPDWPVNSPNEFIFTSSPRAYSLYHDFTIKLDPPDFASVGAAVPTVAHSQELHVGATSSSVYNVPGGLIDSTAASVVRFGDNRFLQRRYTLRFKLPIRALQAWSQAAAGDVELRQLNRKFKLVFVHSPTRFWADTNVHPFGGTPTVTDTWPISWNANPSELTFQLRETVQCPSVRLNVMMVIHHNRKVDQFTTDYEEGLDHKNADPDDDAVPGGSVFTEAAWRQGTARGSQTATFFRTPKRTRVE